MILTKKSLIFFLSFILIISLLANFYSFSNKNQASENLNNEIDKYKQEVIKKNAEIKKLNEEVTEIKESKIETLKNQTEEQTPDEVIEESENSIEDNYVNAAKKFIEYAFTSDAETYTTRKKLAQNYMTDDLIETLFPSDGVDENKQKLNTNVEQMTVYKNPDNEEEVLVYYVLNEEIKSTGYKETVKKYVKLNLVNEANVIKVSKVESLNMDDGGI